MARDKQARADRIARMKKETYALYLAARDPRVPWYAKVLAVLVVAYALSPIDLIPDFIPGIGYLDDLIIVPAGIALSIRLVPADVMEDCRARAGDTMAGARRVKWIAIAIVAGIWLLLSALLIVILIKIF